MEKTINYPTEEGSERRPKQFALPPVVRRAVSIAMLAGASANCTEQQHIGKQPHTAIAEITTVQTSVQESQAEEETLTEGEYFTPSEAILATLSEPLKFVAQFDGEHFGTSTPVYLWRNSKVLVRFHPCETKDELPNAETKCTSQRVVIHSKQGKTIDIRTEDPFEQLNEGLGRNDYVKYMELPVTKYQFDMSPENYENLVRTIREQKTGIRSCIMRSSGFTCKNIITTGTSKLEEEIRKFWNKPDKDWRQMLITLMRAYNIKRFE